MKTKLTFSITLTNLTATQLETVLSTYETLGDPEMKVQAERKKKSKRGAHSKTAAVQRNARYRFTNEAPGCNGQPLKAYQALKKLQAIDESPWPIKQMKEWLVSQKVSPTIGGASPVITRLRREGTLEIVE